MGYARMFPVNMKSFHEEKGHQCQQQHACYDSPLSLSFFSYDPLICKINGFKHHSQYLQIMICKHDYSAHLVTYTRTEIKKEVNRSSPAYSDNDGSLWPKQNLILSDSGFSGNPYQDMKIHQIVIPHLVRIFYRLLYLNPFGDFHSRVLRSFLKSAFQSVHTELIRTPCDKGHPIACHLPAMFLISRFGKSICGKSVQRFQSGAPRTSLRHLNAKSSV